MMPSPLLVTYVSVAASVTVPLGFGGTERQKSTEATPPTWEPPRGIATCSATMIAGAVGGADCGPRSISCAAGANGACRK